MTESFSFILLLLIQATVIKTLGLRIAKSCQERMALFAFAQIS